MLRYFVRAANAAGIGSADASTIGSLGTHSMEAYLPLLARCGGTPVGIQQKLMRHGDIRTTMNTYGPISTKCKRLTPKIGVGHGKTQLISIKAWPGAKPQPFSE